MSRYLLLIALGPVQEFIAQARRTRDLWFGSHLLSELSRAVAQDLLSRGATLVFPAFDANDAELEPCDGPLRPLAKPARSRDKDDEVDERLLRPPLAVPNRLLAVLKDSDDPPEALVHQARAASETRWNEFAKRVEDRCKGLIAPTAKLAWDEQLATFLEFNAAWTEFGEGESAYCVAREALEQELRSRKLLRDFPAWKQQRGSVPKSSLDGARETVLNIPAERAPHLVKRYRITEGEQLDAIGLVKRAGGKPEQFVPIANVALAPFIAAAKERHEGLLKDVDRFCAAEGMARVKRRDLACGRVFAFDAEVFLEDRWRPILDERRGTPTNAEQRRKRVLEARRFGERLRPLLDKMLTPYPYVACLVADGDRVGGALENLDVSEHREFSNQLSGFASRAREIVEQDHPGILVYAGGDDVLAFVGVQDAVECSVQLRAAFKQSMQQAQQALGKVGSGKVEHVPTLSIGIGIGHLLESMGQLRKLGRDAEHLAKSRRNALAIVVDKRSGGTTSFCESWTEEPATRLQRAVALLDGALSMSKVHEIQRELSRLPARGVLLPGEQSQWSELLQREVGRILARTGDGSGLSGAEVDLVWRVGASYDVRRQDADAWCSRMLIARELSEAIQSTSEREHPRGAEVMAEAG